MLVEYHRLAPPDSINPDETSRISIEAKDIVSIHEGHGGVTVITTSQGKIVVEESYDEAVNIRAGGCRAF